MEKSTHFEIPRAAFKKFPPRGNRIYFNTGKMDASRRPTFRIEIEPSQAALDFIAQNYVFDVPLSRMQYTRLAQALGDDAYNWKILLDRYDSTNSAKLFLRLFSPDVLSVLPNLSPMSEEQSVKLSQIFYSTGLVTKIGTTPNSILVNLGMDNVAAYLHRARATRWVDRGTDELSRDTLNTLEKTIGQIRYRKNSLTVGEANAFNKTVICVVAQKLKSETISSDDTDRLIAHAHLSLSDLEDKVLDLTPDRSDQIDSTPASFGPARLETIGMQLDA